MTDRKPFTIFAAVIFAVMALLHLFRLFAHFQVVLGRHVVPIWASYAAIVVAGILAWGLFREARR